MGLTCPYLGAFLLLVAGLVPLSVFFDFEDELLDEGLVVRWFGPLLDPVFAFVGAMM